MKKIFSLLFVLIFLLTLSDSCTKGVVTGDPKYLISGAYPTLLTQGNANLDYIHIDTSTVSITVGEKGSPVASVNLWVVRGSNLNPSSWKLIKNVPFKDSAVLSVTGAEIGQALSIPADSIKTGLTIYPEVVTTDGRKFSISNTPTNFQSFPSYNMALIWPINLINFVCPYDQAFFDGNFAIISDQWNDFAAGDLIPVKPGPAANQITISLYPSPNVGSNRMPIILNVDPATDSVSIPLQPIGDYPGDPNYSMQGIGTVSVCSGIISLTVFFQSPLQGSIPDAYNVQMIKQ